MRWWLQLMDQANWDLPVAATSDYMALSLERRLSQPGLFDAHLPRDSVFARGCAVGRLLRVYRGTTLMSLVVITDRVWTEASVRLVGRTQEYLLQWLGLPPATPVIESIGQTGVVSSRYKRQMHALVAALCKRWRLVPFAKHTWSQCTITGGYITADKNVQNSTGSATVTVETPWIDLSESGAVLDHVARIMAYTAQQGQAGYCWYATSNSQGTPSWTTLGQRLYAYALDESWSVVREFWGHSSTITLQRYLKVKAQMTTNSGATQVWYELMPAVRGPRQYVTPSGSIWPTSSPSVDWSSLDNWYDKSLLAILDQIVAPMGYEWEVTPGRELRLYTLPAQSVGIDKRGSVALVWGENVHGQDWVRESDRDVVTTAYEVSVLPPASMPSPSRGSREWQSVVYVARADDGVGDYWRSEQADVDDVPSVATHLDEYVATHKRGGTEISVDVVYLPGVEQIAPGDLVTLVVPEHGVRLPVRVVGVETKAAENTERWSLELSTVLKSPWGPPTVEDPPPDNVRRGKPRRTTVPGEVLRAVKEGS